MSVPIISSNLFSSYPSLVFGFSTRLAGVSPEPFGMNIVGDERQNVLENRQRFLSQVGANGEALAIPRQIHGAVVRRAARPGVYSDCDALISNTPGVFLTVATADCLPIFIFDPPTKSIAAVHAGWRGSLQRIVQKALTAMSDAFTADPQSMLVFIGPSARVCCYEVGEEVASQFDSRFLVHREDHRPYLDMHLLTVTVLLKMGVEKSHIESSNHCTICTPHLFHSYRRDRERSGRMMGVIGMRDY